MLNKKNKKIDLLYDKESEFDNQKYYNESDRRDIYYSALLKDLIKNNRSSQKLKKIFFWFICIVFVFVCVFSLLIIFSISRKDNITYGDVGVAITGFGSILSSIIALPLIIAKHLFPQNSEEVRFKFINKVQGFDQFNIQEAQEILEESDDIEN